MAGNKTVANDGNVVDFLNKIEQEQKRQDCFQIVAIMEAITGEKPVMWGDSIIGFGNYHYKYASGREGDFFLAGFSPRKTNISIYIMGGLSQHQDTLAKIGKHKTGKTCLYIKKLADINEELLKGLIEVSVKKMREKYQ
jgi:hypothetical protein